MFNYQCRIQWWSVTNENFVDAEQIRNLNFVDAKQFENFININYRWWIDVQLPMQNSMMISYYCELCWCKAVWKLKLCWCKLVCNDLDTNMNYQCRIQWWQLPDCKLCWCKAKTKTLLMHRNKTNVSRKKVTPSEQLWKLPWGPSGRTTMVIVSFSLQKLLMQLITSWNSGGGKGGSESELQGYPLTYTPLDFCTYLL